jgi:tRNA(adenine34) deaminase
MKLAIEQAEIARNIDETPVGCVIVKDGKIISTGYNRRECEQNAISHAEITAIKTACEVTGFWRLVDCDLYVTLEPCPMCGGAIINSRIRRVIYGCEDKKSGAFGSVINLNDYNFNHKPEIIGGVLREETSSMLSEFFSDLRKRKAK